MPCAHHDELSEKIIGCAIKVHRTLGPGLLESVYRRCLAYEIRKLGLACEMEKPLPVRYGDMFLGLGLRLDLLVEKQLVVETKTVRAFRPVHQAQLLTYLRLARHARAAAELQYGNAQRWRHPAHGK